MSGKPIIVFDTSGLNRLAKDADSQPLVAGLRAGYRVCLTAMSVDELLATPKVEDRTKFFDYCRRISPDGIICLASAGLIIQKMVATFSRNPDAFDWMHVTICLKAYEDAIARYEEIVTDEKLSEEQRNFAKKVKKTFEGWFRNLKPGIRAIYEKAGSRPHPYAEVLKLSQEDGGIFWGFAKELYRTAQEWNASFDSLDGPDPDRRESERIPVPDDDTVKSFVSACPSFRCVVLAFILVWYDRSVRGDGAKPRFEAGNIDHYMSAYLPYFPQFITDDPNQQSSLQEIATVCGLNTQVRLYDDFYTGFMVMGKSA
ncbi:MAG: hypothetical protein DMG65_26985 [Candidatus Angelobacter sp. Gp1-AA117]|nr:MAG: hypothetical protein DMG65_26985 [Candidatus Angelobacter sp. Gp1-AA117]